MSGWESHVCVCPAIAVRCAPPFCNCVALHVTIHVLSPAATSPHYTMKVSGEVTREQTVRKPSLLKQCSFPLT